MHGALHSSTGAVHIQLEETCSSPRRQSFKEAKKKDLVDVVSSIEAEKTEYDTKRTEKECIKCFYRWLKGGGDGEEYPEEVCWMRSKRTLNHRILSDDLLTGDEVKLMED